MDDPQNHEEDEHAPTKQLIEDLFQICHKALYQNFQMQISMPHSRSAGVPVFKGKHLSNFLDSLAFHVEQAQIDQDNLPKMVLCYCSLSICKVLQGTSCFQGCSWMAVVEYMTKLYSSSDKMPPASADHLHTWVTEHTSNGSIGSTQSIDRYFCKFTRRYSGLISKGNILQIELNQLFYRGILTPSVLGSRTSCPL